MCCKLDRLIYRRVCKQHETLSRAASRLPFQLITLWCPPLPANFLKRELPQLSLLRRVTFCSIGCLHMTSLLWDYGSCRLQTQVYKPLFPAFISQLLDFSPYEQHIFVHNESFLCFLGLADLSIHKQHKTQASWVSATDSYGEKKSLPALQLHFARHQNHVFANNLYFALSFCSVTTHAQSAQITHRQEMSM